MYEALQRLGVPMAVFDHDTFLPVDHNAVELADLVDEKLGTLDEVSLVCHSRGGLVARAAIDLMPDALAQRMRLHTLGTPHLGTPLAEFDRLVPLLRLTDALLHLGD